jgi:hypothetical protein
MCDGKWSSRDADELRARMERSMSGAQLGPAPEVMRNYRAAWVLIFNAGRSNEGVYTLQGRQSPSRSYVLAFQQNTEAERFATLLQGEGFDMAQPMEWQHDQLVQFCEMGQFEVGVVPTGTLLTPPTHNEYDMEAFNQLNEEQGLECSVADKMDCINPDANDWKSLERMWREDDGSFGA